MRIMIVDDHIDMRRVLRQIVSKNVKNDVDFIECMSGEEAIHQYSVHKPSIVLMDIELTKMNGFEATKIICDSDSEAKVVIVTSYDSLSFRKKAREVNAMGFISKDSLSDIHTYLQTIIK
ncbi:response regulator [bacterium]|nr:MAG: response regulator [bacterium]